jgi:hypothetical protein
MGRRVGEDEEGGERRERVVDLGGVTGDISAGCI